MTTYTAIPDANLEVDKPIRSVDGLLLRDNPIAITEGATGAPKNQPLSLNLYTAGTHSIAKSVQTSTTSTSYVRVYSAYIPRSGTVSTTISLLSTSGLGGAIAFARIYVNGVAFGVERSTASATYVTFDEDIAVSAGDIVQLYLKRSGTTDSQARLDIKSALTSVYDNIAEVYE